eukprot:jgi/Ulvmu1/5400/UM022_0195.1
MLKAALEGGTAPDRKVAAVHTKAPLDLLQSPAFPCLRHAEGEVIEAPPAPEDGTFEAPDVSAMHLAGTSAPIGSIPADKADYEIHPSKRRGGEEIVSSSFMGLASLPKSQSIARNASLIRGEVIGSMPDPLTMEQRLSIARATPMSPALNRFGSVGMDNMGMPTLQGQKLRRSVLRGAVVVFITAGYSGKRFIFERCAELGVRSVIIDGPESWSQQLVEDGLAEDFIGIDFGDAETLFDRLLDACRQVRSKLGDLDGIVTFCELAVPLAARLSERLGLPGNSPEAVDTARNKHAARACMERAGLPTPRNTLIKTAEDLAEAAEHVGFPAVIKPISGAASIGVIRVNDREQLETSFKRVLRDLKGARVVAGALVEASEEETDTDGNAGRWMDLSIMMEEYLDGPEVDVDLVLSRKQAVYGAVTDNWPTVEPYFNETGSNCPSLLPRKEQLELVALGIQAVQCMGFDAGVFHVELKYTSRGARLIEVNARMGGGPVRDTNLLVWGVDLVEQQLLASCGIPCCPGVSPKPLTELAELSVNAMQTGIMEDTDYVKGIDETDGVLYARSLVPAGGACVSVEDGLPTWVAELMVQRSPVAEAVAFIKDLEQQMYSKMRITPKPISALT